MPDTTIDIPSSASTETVTETAPAQVAIDFEHWNKTGEARSPQDATDTAASSPATTEKADSSTAAAKGAESATATDDLEQNLSKEQRKAARKDRIDELRLENSELKRRLERLETSAAGTATKSPETKPAATDTLKKPRIKDYPNTDEGTAKWEDDTEAYNDAKLERALQREKAAVASTEGKRSLDTRIEAAKAKYSDFAEVADAVDVSSAMLELIRTRPDGMDLLYHLGQTANVEEAKRIAGLTDVDGLDYKSFMAASKNPATRDRIQRALGRAEAELDRMALQMAAPKKTETPIKALIAAKPRPSAETGRSGSGTTVGDPLAEAYKNGDFNEIDRLERAAALAKAR